MENFRIEIAKWSEVQLGDEYALDLDGGGTRYRFAVITSGRVTVYGLNEGKETILGTGDQYFKVDTAAVGPLSVRFEAEPPVRVFAKFPVDANVMVYAKDQECYAMPDIGRKPATDFDKMMIAMQANEQRREKTLAVQLERLRSERRAAGLPETLAEARAIEARLIEAKKEAARAAGLERANEQPGDSGDVQEPETE